MSKSYKAMVCALLMGTLAVSTSGQSTYEALRNHKNKAARFGGPSLIQQVEYMQTAVNMLQNYISTFSKHNPNSNGGHKQFYANTGDHITQFIRG